MDFMHANNSKITQRNEHSNCLVEKDLMFVYSISFLMFVTNVVGVSIKLPTTTFLIMSLDYNFNTLLNFTLLMWSLICCFSIDLYICFNYFY